MCIQQNTLYVVNTGLGTQYCWFGKSECFAQHNYHAEHANAKRDWGYAPKKILKLHAQKLNLSSLGVVLTLAVHIYVRSYICL